MRDDIAYLRGDVVTEPLIGQWYAWPHLISPATRAMNVVGRHLKIMNSYVSAPEVHTAAVKNPRMLGGPFIDYPENRVEEIRRLIMQTLADPCRLVEFAEAVIRLYQLLKVEAGGFCLDPLYPRIPEPLRGFVELFYDVQNRPCFRFFEALLYRSRYYDRSAQSLDLHVAAADDRAFVLSTPRLPSANSVALQFPFDDPRLDRLFRMRDTAGKVSAIGDELGILPERKELFRSFFTTASPRPRARYDGRGIRIRYFGHACLLFETRDVSIMSDPVISLSNQAGDSRFTYQDLPPEIDYVVITHNHQDHVLVETLLQLRHIVRNVVVPRNGTGQLQDPNLKLAFNALGFQNVIELDELDELDLPGGRLTALPFLGEHADLGIRTKLCHHISFGGWSTLVAADSRPLDIRVYEHVHAVVGDVDVLFLGMECNGAPLSWLYGPLLAEPITHHQDRSRRLSASDCERGLQLVELFRPQQVFVYAMGQEPWLNHLMAIRYTADSPPIIESDLLVKECRRRGITAERLFYSKETFHREARRERT